MGIDFHDLALMELDEGGADAPPGALRPPYRQGHLDGAESADDAHSHGDDAHAVGRRCKVEKQERCPCGSKGAKAQMFRHGKVR